MKKLLVLVLLMYVLSSCTKHNDKLQIIYSKLFDYPKIELKAQPVILSQELMYPYQFWVYRSDLLMVYEIKDEEGFLHFYDLKSGEFKGKFGKYGRGKTEFLLPKIRIKGDSVFVISYNRNCKFSFQDVLGSLTFPVTDITVSKFDTDADSKWVMNDTLALLEFYRYPFQLYFLRDSILEGFNMYPDFHKEELSPSMLKQLYSFHCDVTADHRHIILNYNEHPVVDFIRFPEMTTVRHILDVGYKNSYKAKYGNVVFDDPRRFYTFSCFADSLDYILFQNSTYLERDNELGRTEIHAFDMNGKLVRRYSLDHYITNFTIDPSSRTVFALAQEEGIPILVKYELN